MRLSLERVFRSEILRGLGTSLRRTLDFSLLCVVRGKQIFEDVTRAITRLRSR